MEYKSFKDMQIDTSWLGQLKAALYFIAGGLTAFLAGVGVEKKLVTLLAIAMLFDTFTGWLKWRRCDPKLIKSKSMKEGIFKKMVSFLVVVPVLVVFHALGAEAGPLVNTYFTVLIVAECYSSIANMHSAVTRDPKEEFDAVSAILKWAKDKMATFIPGLTPEQPQEPAKPDNQHDV